MSFTSPQCTPDHATANVSLSLVTDSLDVISPGNLSLLLVQNEFAVISPLGWRGDMGWRNDDTDSALTTEKILAIVIVSILNVFMLVGNTISIVTIVKTPSLRNQTYYWFVLNLAIVDLLNSMTVVPIHTVWEAHGPWPFGQIFCNIVIFLDMAFSAIASYSTVLVSLDKFVCITKPFLYHHNKASMAAIISVIAVWIVWLTFSAVSVFSGIARNPSLNKNMTYRIDPCNFIMTDSYAISSAIVSFFIPLIIIVFTSIKIICVAKRHICRIEANKFHSTIDEISSANEHTPPKGKDVGHLSTISKKKLQQTNVTQISSTNKRTSLNHISTVSPLSVLSMKKLQQTVNCSKIQSTNDGTSPKTTVSPLSVLSVKKLQETANSCQTSSANDRTFLNGATGRLPTVRKLQHTCTATSCHTGDISQSITTESTCSKRNSKGFHPYRKTFSLCRAFGTIMIVTLFFIVMFAPYWFAAIIDVGCSCIPPYIFEDYLMVFYYMHSLVNPYIYMATDRRYKSAIGKLYRKYFKRNKIHVKRTSKDKL